MNADALARLYDRLTPLERLPLIMAAVERGDDAEADRLSRSAPRMHVGLPDYHGLGDGLLLLSLLHMIGQLHLGLLYWRGSELAAEWQEFARGKEDKARGDRLWGLVRMAAYRIVIESDGWRRLCGELKIDPEALLRDMPAYEELRRTEEAARLAAYTAEEAADYLRRSGGREAEPPTAEDAARAMRDVIDRRVAWWG
jgi:hypothetical protein